MSSLSGLAVSGHDQSLRLLSLCPSLGAQPCPKKLGASLAEQVLCEKARIIFALEINNSNNRTIPPQPLLCFLSIASCFVSDTHKWFTPKVSGMVPGARDGHSACVLAKSMFIFGGYEQLVSSLC